MGKSAVLYGHTNMGTPGTHAVGKLRRGNPPAQNRNAPALARAPAL